MILRMAASLLSGVLLTGCSVVGIRNGTEEPHYSVVKTESGLEIRAYGPRLAAETEVGGSAIAARSEGFRRIAGFIFGGNHGEVKIAMTAPVTTAPTQSPQTIAMTAPVTQAATANGWRVRFFMPAKYTMESLPKPNDDRVKIIQIPAETYAVYRYSGSISPESTEAAHAELQRRLAGTSYVAQGAIVDWFYDPPWTLPPLRRNEAAVVVEARP